MRITLKERTAQEVEEAMSLLGNTSATHTLNLMIGMALAQIKVKSQFSAENNNNGNSSNQ